MNYTLKSQRQLQGRFGRGRFGQGVWTGGLEGDGSDRGRFGRRGRFGDRGRFFVSFSRKGDKEPSPVSKPSPPSEPSPVRTVPFQTPCPNPLSKPSPSKPTLKLSLTFKSVIHIIRQGVNHLKCGARPLPFSGRTAGDAYGSLCVFYNKSSN